MINKKDNINLIYQEFSKPLFYCSYRIIGEYQQAEEIMQDTILKYYHYKNKNEIDNINKWLKSICIRKSIDYLRNKKRLEINLDNYKNDTEQSSLSLEIDTSIGQEELIELIKESVNKLPDKYRLVISLILYEGYDYEEIEQINNIKSGSLRTIYSRGIAKLNLIIKEKLKCKI